MSVSTKDILNDALSVVGDICLSRISMLLECFSKFCLLGLYSLNLGFFGQDVFFDFVLLFHVLKYLFVNVYACYKVPLMFSPVEQGVISVITLYPSCSPTLGNLVFTYMQYGVHVHRLSVLCLLKLP